MFGANYQFVQPPLKATSGEYDVILTKVEERNLKGYPVLSFYFKYKDDVDRVPNCFDLFDVTNPNDKEKLRAFNCKMSKIALCFDLQGDFSQTSYYNWVGKSGRIVISRSEKGFLNVTDFVAKSETQTF